MAENKTYDFTLVNRQGDDVPGVIDWSYNLNYDENRVEITINSIQFTGTITEIIKGNVSCNLSINNIQCISNNDFSSNAYYIDINQNKKYINLTDSLNYYINKNGYIVYKSGDDEIICKSTVINVPFLEKDEAIKNEKIANFILKLQIQLTSPESFYSINLKEIEEIISIDSGLTPYSPPNIVSDSKFITPRGKSSITWQPGTAGKGEQYISKYKINIQYYINTNELDPQQLEIETSASSNTIVIDFNEILNSSAEELVRGSEVLLKVSTISNVNSFYNSEYSTAVIEVVNIKPSKPNIKISSGYYEEEEILCSKVNPNTKILIHAEAGSPNNEGQNSYVYYKQGSSFEEAESANLQLYTSNIQEQINSDIYYIFYTYDESFIEDAEKYNVELEYSDPVRVHIIQATAPSVKIEDNKNLIYSKYSNSPRINNSVTTTCTSSDDSNVTRIIWYIRYSLTCDSNKDINGEYTQKIINTVDITDSTSHIYNYSCLNVKQNLDIPYGYYYQIGATLIDNNLYKTQLVLSSNYWEADTLEGEKTYKKEGSVYYSDKFYFNDKNSKTSITPNTTKKALIYWSITDTNYSASAKLYGGFPTAINAPEIIPRHKLNSPYNGYYEDGNNDEEDNKGIEVTWSWDENVSFPDGFDTLWCQFYYKINDGDWINANNKTLFDKNNRTITYNDIQSHGGNSGCFIEYCARVYRDTSSEDYIASSDSNSLAKVKLPQWTDGKDEFSYTPTRKDHRQDYIRPNFLGLKKEDSLGQLSSSEPGFGNDTSISKGQFTYNIYAKTNKDTIQFFTTPQKWEGDIQYTINQTDENFSTAKQISLFGSDLNTLFEVQFYIEFYDVFGQLLSTKTISVYVDYREVPSWTGSNALQFGRTIKFLNSYEDNNPHYYRNEEEKDKNFTALTGQYLTAKFPMPTLGYEKQKLKYTVELYKVEYDKNTHKIIESSMISSNLIQTYSFLTKDIPTETGIENKGIRIIKDNNNQFIEYRFCQLTSDLIGTKQGLGILIKIQDQMAYEDNIISQKSPYLIVGCTLSKPYINISNSECSYSSGILVSNNTYNIVWPEQLYDTDALQKTLGGPEHTCTLTFQFSESGAFTTVNSSNAVYEKYTNVSSGTHKYEDTGTAKITSKTIYIRIKFTYTIADLNEESTYSQTIYSEPYICYMEGPTISPRYHAVGINNITLGADGIPITLAVSGFNNGIIARQYIIMTNTESDPEYILAYDHLYGKLYASNLVYKELCMEEDDIKFDS